MNDKVQVSNSIKPVQKKLERKIARVQLIITIQIL